MTTNKANTIFKVGFLLLLAFLFLSLATNLNAQQAQLYTQFMYNKLQQNAGYAGSVEQAQLQILYRKQWLDLDGAPEAQVLSLNLPFNNGKTGMGLNLERQLIGIQEHMTINGIYAYRIRVAKTGFLGLGVNLSARYLEQDFTDERLRTTEGFELDRAIERGNFNQWLANVGFGAFLKTPKFYMGFSIPRLGRISIDFDEEGEDSREERHINFMTGYTFDLSQDITFTPQLLTRFTEGTPFDLDINCMFGFYNRFFAGLTYRHYNGEMSVLAESIDILAGIHVMPQLYLGFAYDYTLSELQNYSNGSIEVIARYNFLPFERKHTYVNPRFF